MLSCGGTSATPTGQRSATSGFNPGDVGSTRLADVAPSEFGSTNGNITYVDSNLCRSSNCYYVVRAVNGGSKISANSNQVGMTPTAVTLIAFEAGNVDEPTGWIVIIMLVAITSSLAFWQRMQTH